MHQLQYRIRDGMESSKKVVFVLDCIFLEIFFYLSLGLVYVAFHELLSVCSTTSCV